MADKPNTPVVEPSSFPGPITEQDAAVPSYVADLCQGLLGMARRSGYPSLANLLDQARIEAERLADLETAGKKGGR